MKYFMLIIPLLFAACTTTKEIKVPYEVKIPVPQKCVYVIPKIQDTNNTVQYIINMSKHIETIEAQLKEIPCLEIY